MYCKYKFSKALHHYCKIINLGRIINFLSLFRTVSYCSATSPGVSCYLHQRQGTLPFYIQCKGHFILNLNMRKAIKTCP